MDQPAYDCAQLFREHAARVERLLLRLGVRASDVPDATQEVFVVAHRKRHAFEGRASVSTWLYRISVRVAAAQRRLARHRREVAADELSESVGAAEGGDDLAAELERRALLEQLSAALEQLSEPQRAVLALHDLEGLRMHEVAARLGIPRKTAFSRVYAARRALADALRKLGHAVPVVLPVWPGGSILGALAKPVAPGLGAKLGRVAQWMRVPATGIVLGAALLAPLSPREPAPQLAAVAPGLPLAAAVVPAPTAPQPSSLAPRQTVAPRAQPRKLLQPARAARQAPLPAAAAEPEPEIVVTRMGSEDLRPVLEHPFAARVQPATSHLPRMIARLSPPAFAPEPPADFD